MIRKALLRDLASVKSLTEACAKRMQENDVFQWNEFYPSLEILAEDIRREELFLLEEEKELQGIIVLTPKMDKEYMPIEWLTSNWGNLYIHRLATNPQTWGSGNGRKLMDFAECFARNTTLIQ